MSRAIARASDETGCFAAALSNALWSRWIEAAGSTPRIWNGLANRSKDPDVPGPL